MRRRPRDLGIKIGKYSPGRYNSITDVKGIRVGHKTLIEGEVGLGPGNGLARTGVTVIMPNNDIFNKKLFAGSNILNGAGEMTGLAQINEWGFLETPIALTSSMNVGIVSDGIAEYMVQKHPEVRELGYVILPVVGECNDGLLNDPSGRYVRQHHVLEAIENAKNGPVDEGSVGAGTGMVSFMFKGGIGTASRKLPHDYTLGALVLTNFGERSDLIIKGVPVGNIIQDMMPDFYVEGSVIVIIATDAPLLPHQLNRLAKRGGLGLARAGSYAQNGSGEIILAFSTANTFPNSDAKDIKKKKESHFRSIKMIKNEALNSIFEATIETIEEATLNSIFMANTMIGRKGTVYGIPIDRVIDIMKKYRAL